MKTPSALRDEAEAEAYQYFDENIRELPKNPDGTINTSAPGFHDNDVDAFRHATSAEFSPRSIVRQQRISSED